MARPSSARLQVPGPDLSGWLELVTASAALVFEADAEGRFTFLAPDPVLGWRVGALLGSSGTRLLAEADDFKGFDPFRPAAPVHRKRCWLRQADGAVRCLSVTALPVLDTSGRVAGARGCAIDPAALDPTEPAVAVALRRADVLDRLLRSLHIERLPEQMTLQALRSFVAMLGGDGALIVDPAAAEIGMVLHAVGPDAPAIVAAACEHLRYTGDGAPAAAQVEMQPMLVCPCPTRFGGQPGLVLWRRAGRQRWDAADLAIAASSAGVLRLVLEHGFVQASLAAATRTDTATGFANRRAFFEELPRRIDRLDRDGLPGTLMLLHLEQFERLGSGVADETLRIAAGMLRATFRPGDLIARLRGGAFAVWMDRADELTAAERAETLCHEGPARFAHLAQDGITVSLAIGIAMRWQDSSEDAEELKQRAELACDRARRAGAPSWRVWHPTS